MGARVGFNCECGIEMKMAFVMLRDDPRNALEVRIAMIVALTPSGCEGVLGGKGYG